jgi:GNAT superfamily N-acetyltransferase
MMTRFSCSCGPAPLSRVTSRGSIFGNVANLWVDGAGGHRASYRAMLEFRPCPADEEPAAALVQGMRDEIAALYEGLDLDGPDMPRAGPRELAPPGGTFVVGFEDGVPVCCGGLKRLPDGACEVKKMFVAPAARGRGVARALLEELERLARELGYATARLDTGPRQARARRMYERAGYVAIENFNANPVATFFGEKPLAAPPAQ